MGDYYSVFLRFGSVSLIFVTMVEVWEKKIH